MDFEVVPAITPVSVEDWMFAKRLPVEGLPSLTEEQRKDLARFRQDEDNYKRFHVVVPQLTLQRQAEQGRRFGKVIQSILEPLGGRFYLVSISRIGSPRGWSFTIASQNGESFTFQSYFDVVETLVESRATPEQWENYRNEILAELGEPVLTEAVR